LDGPTDTFADHHAAGQVYVRLYQITGQSSDLTQITSAVRGMVENHVIDRWYWIDALNMSMPCFAQLGAMYSDSTIWAQMYKLYSYPKQTLLLYDQSKSLWWRDVSYRNTSYWSRGNGWVFAAHAKVLSALQSVQQSDPNWTEYLTTFQSMAARLLTLQTPGGYWNSDLAGSTYVGPESSGTAFFLYGLSFGVLKGLLDPVKYVPAIAAAWNYFVTTAIKKTGFLGYVQPGADAPGTAPASNTEDFGVGAFLLAASQLAQLVT
jgi:rhamnogalacturonyl hydrolase YesR